MISDFSYVSERSFTTDASVSEVRQALTEQVIWAPTGETRKAFAGEMTETGFSGRLGTTGWAFARVNFECQLEAATRTTISLRSTPRGEAISGLALAIPFLVWTTFTSPSIFPYVFVGICVAFESWVWRTERLRAYDLILAILSPENLKHSPPARPATAVMTSRFC